MFSRKMSAPWRGSNAVYIAQLFKRTFMVGLPNANQQAQIADLLDAKYHTREDEEWLSAKSYSSLPGPSKVGMFMNFLPGGRLHNTNLIELNREMRKQYGDICLIKGTFGKIDLVCTYNPNDFELVCRNEGTWPIRIGLESFRYYRKEFRPEVFHGNSGIVSEQGQAWADIRNKVNPILMKLQNVRQMLPQIDRITWDFMHKLETLLDPATNKLTTNFHDEVRMWAFESISFVALNSRTGMLSDKPDPNALTLFENMADFFQYTFEYDVLPAYWRYIRTPGFNHLMRTLDSITDITTNYIEAAIKKFEAEGNKEATSVLEKLCRLDKKVAIIVATDMLMAGFDTTSSVFVTLLYKMAKHPEKQEILRQELRTILPDANTPLTESNTQNMPYLRACLKEALRLIPITPSNFRVTIKDLVLSGYQVPRGTGVLMGVMALSNSEQFFPQADQFLPERWVKKGEHSCPAAKHKNPFAYMPFGFGPRTCIGKRIAEMEIETLLARLLRNYRVSWTGAQELEYISNIILVPHGELSFTFEPIRD